MPVAELEAALGACENAAGIIGEVATSESTELMEALGEIDDAIDDAGRALHQLKTGGDSLKAYIAGIRSVEAAANSPLTLKPERKEQLLAQANRAVIRDTTNGLLKELQATVDELAGSLASLDGRQQYTLAATIQSLLRDVAIQNDPATVDKYVAILMSLSDTPNRAGALLGAASLGNAKAAEYTKRLLQYEREAIATELSLQDGKVFGEAGMNSPELNSLLSECAARGIAPDTWIATYAVDASHAWALRVIHCGALRKRDVDVTEIERQLAMDFTHKEIVPPDMASSLILKILEVFSDPEARRLMLLSYYSVAAETKMNLQNMLISQVANELAIIDPDLRSPELLTILRRQMPPDGMTSPTSGLSDMVITELSENSLLRGMPLVNAVIGKLHDLESVDAGILQRPYWQKLIKLNDGTIMPEQIIAAVAKEHMGGDAADSTQDVPKRFDWTVAEYAGMYASLGRVKEAQALIMAITDTSIRGQAISECSYYFVKDKAQTAEALQNPEAVDTERIRLAKVVEEAKQSGDVTRLSAAALDIAQNYVPSCPEVESVRAASSTISSAKITYTWEGMGEIQGQWGMQYVKETQSAKCEDLRRREIIAIYEQVAAKDIYAATRLAKDLLTKFRTVRSDFNTTETERYLTERLIEQGDVPKVLAAKSDLPPPGPERTVRVVSLLRRLRRIK